MWSVFFYTIVRRSLVFSFLLIKEIHLELKPHKSDELHSETIKVHHSHNLGATSANNKGVYKIDKWDGKEGPFIAKHFNSAREKDKEAKHLGRVVSIILIS